MPMSGSSAAQGEPEEMEPSDAFRFLIVHDNDVTPTPRDVTSIGRDKMLGGSSPKAFAGLAKDRLREFW